MGDDRSKIGHARQNLSLCDSIVREQVKGQFAFPETEAPEAVPSDADTLIVAGGGTLIDRAKVFRKNNWPALNLVAIPSDLGQRCRSLPSRHTEWYEERYSFQ